MATTRWRGDAPAIAQLNTITVGGTAANGQVYQLSINGKVVSYTAIGTDTNTTIATSLFNNLVASVIPEFAEISWANPSAGVITGTANTAGVPFTNTSSATGTGTLVTVVTTANSGPSDISVAQNWSLGVLPAAADDVYFEGSNVNASYGLSALSAITLNSLNIAASYTGQIGLLQYNGAYWEYRPVYLQVGATTINIGYGQGSGSGLIKINNGAVATTLLVSGTAPPAEANGQSVRWYGTNATNVVEVTRGSVGIAAVPGETATVATLYSGYQTNVAGDASIICGSGTTLTTINQSGGNLTLNSAFTTLTQQGGTCTILGTAGSTTVTVDVGTLYWSSTGNPGTINVGNVGTVSYNQDARTGKTITTLNLYKGATFLDTLAVVGTWTNPIHLVRCRISEVTLDLGENRNLAPT